MQWTSRAICPFGPRWNGRNQNLVSLLVLDGLETGLPVWRYTRTGSLDLFRMKKPRMLRIQRVFHKLSNFRIASSGVSGCLLRGSRCYAGSIRGQTGRVVVGGNNRKRKSPGLTGPRDSLVSLPLPWNPIVGIPW
jgi:hypothetical protein